MAFEKEGFGGNPRLRRAGEEIPMTEEQVKAYRLVDNKVGELAEWDFLKLEKEITGLPEYDFEGFGFDLQEIEDKLGIEKEIIDDAYEIPETIETKVKKGEVWQLGKHRLLCGDSTKEEDIETLFNCVETAITAKAICHERLDKIKTLLDEKISTNAE